MKKPYIKHQKIYPLNISVENKHVKKYDPTKPSPPLNINVENTEAFRSLEKQNKSKDKDIKELERMVRQMYGENIVWI